MTKTTDTAPVRTGYAPVNGLNMYYEIHGEGPPLVLLHGAFSAIGTSFHNVLPALAETRQVIGLEMQAHGRTADIDRPLSPEQMADDTVAALEHLGVEKADFFGYSMGSDVALHVVVRHPDVVRKLVLASAAYTLSGVHPGLMDGLAEMKPEMMFGSPWHEEYMRIAPRPEDFAVLFEKKTQMDREHPAISRRTRAASRVTTYPSKAATGACPAPEAFSCTSCGGSSVPAECGRSRQLQGRTEPDQVLAARYRDDAEAAQVRRRPLHVEQAARPTVGPQQPNQRNESDLRGVPSPRRSGVEHRLAGEEPADRHAVQPTGQPTFGAPGLDRVCPAQPVQPAVGRGDVLGDPRTRPGRVRAPGDDVGERCVDPDLEMPAGPAQRPRHLQPVDRQHAAWVRRPPCEPGVPSEYPAHRHREEPRPVCGQQRPRLQVRTDAGQAVVVRAMGRRQNPASGRRLDRRHAARLRDHDAGPPSPQHPNDHLAWVRPPLPRSGNRVTDPEAYV